MEYPTQERLRELFDYDSDTGSLIRKFGGHGRNVGEIVGTKSPDGYYVCGVGGKFCVVHRLIYIWLHGAIPTGIQVDHLNGIRTDNRPQNLRLVTSSGNARNRGLMKNNTSGYPGVFYNGTGYYRAMIYTDVGKKVYLGQYKTAQEAAVARKAAEVVYGYSSRV